MSARQVWCVPQINLYYKAHSKDYYPTLTWCKGQEVWNIWHKYIAKICWQLSVSCSKIPFDIDATLGNKGC